ncbi:MAG: hypothetical protein IJI46_08340 [Erysipelotrichaceae bacterium]|nr:hypothetical protein [Erysipelotrichaceae bacterium]
MIENDLIINSDKYSTVKRNYKDSLFIFLFGKNKKFALSLYNAMNDSDLKDPDDIIFNTIDDFFYLGRKNDVSFIIDGQMNIYEHQSTYSSTIPLRMLVYLSWLYEAYLQEEKESLYARKRKMLPTPRFVVFYNGLEDIGEERILKLSDSFINTKQADIDLQVRMININFRHNMELLNRCKELYEYAWFVSSIRSESARTGSLESAMENVIIEMPEDFQIKPLIEKNRAEVTGMLFTEWDEEKERKKWEDTTSEYWSEYYKEYYQKYYEEYYKKHLMELYLNKISELSAKIEELEKQLTTISETRA